jgi:hypothetical protein
MRVDEAPVRRENRAGANPIDTPTARRMIHHHRIQEIPLLSGDVLCTHDGSEESLFGAVWRLLGRLLPGEIDHCVVYVGPGGRCVESGARGVIVFEMPGETWESIPLALERGLVDELVGVAYPLAQEGLTAEEEARIRQGVVDYCLEMAAENRPYNFDFLNAQTARGFYCSQLVYKAYLQFGVDLNRNLGVPDDPLLGRIVFPEEIWNACLHRRVGVREGDASPVP